MLKNMSDYSIEQPKVIGDLCSELFISPAYAPALDLMVEAFLTVHSFSLLMFEGLISNASAILRILIEQVSAVTVICNNPKAMTEFLKFQTWKKQYYSSKGEEHEKIRVFLFEKAEYRHKNESALKDYLDYGWIRALNNNKSERSEQLIIKEARLEEMIVDINEQLNAFAHGQRSIFSFIRNKDLSDKHISRIIMVAGKLFLFLCYAKHKLLVNENMTSDKFFNSYLNTKILFLDLNARAVNSRIIDFIKCSNNIDRDIVYSISSLDHKRGLMYQSELNYLQVNMVARAYILDLINFMFMISYKYFFTSNADLFSDAKNLTDLVKAVGTDKLSERYNRISHLIQFDKLVEMVDLIDDNWGPMKADNTFSELDEIVMTDFTSLVHSLFDEAYKDFDKKELLKAFVPID